MAREWGTGSRTAAVAALLASLVFTGCGSTAVEEHDDDGEHPLSLTYGGTGTVGIAEPEDVGPGGTWHGMFGKFILCVAQGHGPITINSVDWAEREGAQPISVAAFVRKIDISDTSPILNAQGSMRDPHHKARTGALEFRDHVEGVEVLAKCPEAGWPEVSQEMFIELEAGPEGASIHDVTVSYTTPDGRRYKVRSDWTFYLCGATATEYCEDNPDSNR